MFIRAALRLIQHFLFFFFLPYAYLPGLFCKKQDRVILNCLNCTPWWVGPVIFYFKLKSIASRGFGKKNKKTKNKKKQKTKSKIKKKNKPPLPVFAFALCESNTVKAGNFGFAAQSSNSSQGNPLIGPVTLLCPRLKKKMSMSEILLLKASGNSCD